MPISLKIFPRKQQSVLPPRNNPSLEGGLPRLRDERWALFQRHCKCPELPWVRAEGAGGHLPASRLQALNTIKAEVWGLLGTPLLGLGPLLLPRPRLAGRWAVQPLGGKLRSRSACPGLESRPSRCREAATLQVPRKARPAPGAGQPESLPGGASAGLLIRTCWRRRVAPGGGGGRWAREPQVGWPGGSEAAAGRRSPVAARALVPRARKAGAVPRPTLRDRPGSAPG